LGGATESQLESPQRKQHRGKVVRPPEYDREELGDLHRRALVGESQAIESITTILLAPLRLRLERRLPYVDSAIISDSVEDALLAYRAQPAMYDASRSGLDTFLVLVASRDVLDKLRRLKVRQRREKAVREQSAILTPTYFEDAEGPAPSRIEALKRAMRDWTDREKAYFAARLAGERSPHVLAEIVGASDGGVAAERLLVKQFNDRLRARLRRQLRARPANLKTGHRRERLHRANK
jgi:hypothetical protein